MPFLATIPILDAYLEDEYYGGLIKGKVRVGKSSYAIQLLCELHGIFENPDWLKAFRKSQSARDFTLWVKDNVTPDWDAWKTRLAYKPWEFIEIVKHGHEQGRKQLGFIWDDCGYWLSAYEWNLDLVKMVARYMDLVASDWACVLFTTPRTKRVITSVRNMPGGHTVSIAKLTGNEYQRDRRRARWYEGWETPDEKRGGVDLLIEDIFTRLLPNRVYAEYKSIRREYVTQAIEDLDKLVAKIRDRYGEKAAEKFEAETVKELSVI